MGEGWKAEMLFRERFEEFVREPRWIHNAVALAQSPVAQIYDAQQITLILAAISAACCANACVAQPDPGQVESPEPSAPEATPTLQ
jgi:hypothetical protein